MADFRIRVKVDSSGAKRGAKETSQSLKGVQAQAQRTKQALLGAFAAVGITAGIGVGIKTLAEFSQEMSTVKAITGATQFQFEELREEAKLLGATTRFSASQAAQGMKFLARAGFETDEVLESIGGTLKLAQAGALDLASAADIASNVLTGFRLETSQMGRVTDVLAKAANSANTDIRQLGDALKLIAPIAAGLNISIEETTAAIGTLSDAGLQGTLAGTGLRRVLSEMEAPSTATAKRLDELNVRLEDIKPSSVGLTGALKQLKLAGVDTGLALELFGDRGGPASEVLKEMIPRVEELTRKLNAAGGTADEISEIMDENLNGALLAVKSAFEAVIIAFGEVGTESALTQFALAAAKSLRWLADNMDTLASTTKAAGIALAFAFAPNILHGIITLVVKLAASIAALSTSMIALSQTATVAKFSTVGLLAPTMKVSGSMAVLKVMLGKVALAFKSLWAVVVANPLLALGAAVIGGAVFALDQLNKKMDEAEAFQERAHQNALRMIQARVKEVRSREEANKKLEEYIEGLRKENKHISKSIEARQEWEAIDKALAIAERTLSAPEKETIRNLVRKRIAIEKNNEILRAEKALLEEIKNPQKEFANIIKLLDSLLEKESITQAEYNTKLKELKDLYGQVVGSADEYIAQLRQENALLQLSSKEQEIKRAVLDAVTIAEGKLADGQEEIIEGLIRERQAIADSNTEMERLKNLVKEIKGPQEELAQRERDLTILRDAGKISMKEYLEQMELLRIGSLRLSTDMESGFTRGLLSIKENIQDVASVAENTLTNAFRGAEDAIVSLVTTGKADFSGLIDSMLADLTRLLLRKMLIAAIPGLQTGGSFTAPGFQTGGSFMVGGQGGPDSQVVPMRLTPGERVDVTRPGEVKEQAASAAPIVNLKVAVVLDPDEVRGTMRGEDGDIIVIDAISRNRSTVRQATA